MSSAFNPDIAGRPQLIKGNSADAVRRHGAADRKLDRQHQEQVYSVTAEVVRSEVRRRRRHHRAGWRHRWLEPLRQGRQAEILLQLLRHRRDVQSRRRRPIPAGTHQVRMEFKYDGGGLAKGGAVTLYVDGKKVGEGRVEQTGADGSSPPTRPATSARKPVRPVRRTTARGQRVQRRGELGADRPREGRPRSHDLAGRALPHCDGETVAARGNTENPVAVGSSVARSDAGDNRCTRTPGSCR